MNPQTESYLDSFDRSTRDLFMRIRQLILATYPETEETFSYRMPSYQLGSNRLHLGCWNHGVSIYGWDRRAAAPLLGANPQLLSGKATIRIPLSWTTGAPSGWEAQLVTLIVGSLSCER